MARKLLHAGAPRTLALPVVDLLARAAKLQHHVVYRSCAEVLQSRKEKVQRSHEMTHGHTAVGGDTIDGG